MVLSILVNKFLQNPAGKCVTVFRSDVEINESVKFPFEDIISAFRVLIPNTTLSFNFTII